MKILYWVALLSTTLSSYANEVIRLDKNSIKEVKTSYKCTEYSPGFFQATHKVNIKLVSSNTAYFEANDFFDSSNFPRTNDICRNIERGLSEKNAARFVEVSSIKSGKLILPYLAR